jgi:hypothetical protein
MEIKYSTEEVDGKINHIGTFVYNGKEYGIMFQTDSNYNEETMRKKLRYAAKLKRRYLETGSF